MQMDLRCHCCYHFHWQLRSTNVLAWRNVNLHVWLGGTFIDAGWVCGIHMRTASIRGWPLIEEIQYRPFALCCSLCYCFDVCSHVLSRIHILISNSLLMLGCGRAGNFLQLQLTLCMRSRVTVLGLCVCVCVSVCLSVCLSVTTLAVTAFIRSPKLKYHRDNYLSWFLGF